MFGLGWLELLVIGGGIMLVAGPAGVRKVAQALQSAQRVKRDLTDPRALQHYLLDDRPPSRLHREGESEGDPGDGAEGDAEDGPRDSRG